MSNYIESGIEWVGKIPKTWNVMPNKRIMHKHKVLCEKYNNEDILSLTMKGVVVRDLDAGGKIPATFDGYQVVYPNNLLMCLFDYDVTPRCVGLIKNEGLTSPAYSQFVLDNGNNPGYYYYYYLMLDHTKELLHLAKNLRHSFTEEQLGEIYTPVPPIKEQIRIANYLDKKIAEIDTVIEKTKETIEDYKKYKVSYTQEIFNHYFTNHKVVYTKIGKISSIVTKQTGFDYSSTIKPSLLNNPNENTYPYLQTRHFKDGEFNFQTEFNIPKDIAHQFPKIILNKRCILFSIVGASIGNVAVYPGNMTSFLGGAICKVDLLEEGLCEYIKEYMISEEGQQQIFSKINSNAQGTITVQNVRDFVIPFPNENIREKILKEVNEKKIIINNLVKEKEKIIEELEKYKKSLIYEYVTGKKEVI